MENIQAYPLDDELLLFSEKANELFGLNTIGTYVWYCLKDHMSIIEIAESLVADFNISTNQAEKDVKTIKIEIEKISNRFKNPDEGIAPFFRSTKHTVGHKQNNTFHSIENYQVHDSSFTIRYEKKEFESWVHPAIEHLQISFPPKQPENYIDIVENDKNCVVICNQKRICNCKGASYLVSIINSELARAAYENIDYLLTVHSAVISKINYSIMLPGVSGAGKSTLSAALVGAGYSYNTDEVAVIQSGSQKVKTIPVSMGIKENSWDILSPYFPNLRKLQVHNGFQGKIIKYLSPKYFQDSNIKTLSEDVKFIVLPEYKDGAATSMTSISRVQALHLLTNSGYETCHKLCETSVKDLINWISNISCYKIQYSSLKEAVQQIDTLTDG